MLEIISMTGFQSGGLGGLLAEIFTIEGILQMLNGEVTLERSLLILVCVLTFLFVYQLGLKDTRRRYDFEKNTRTSRYYDPTLDVDSRKSLEDFKQRPDISTTYINYAPKETQDQYKNL